MTLIIDEAASMRKSIPIQTDLLTLNLVTLVQRLFAHQIVSCRRLCAVGAMPRTVGALPRTVGALPRTVGALPRTVGALPRTVGALPQCAVGALPRTSRYCAEHEQCVVGIGLSISGFRVSCN